MSQSENSQEHYEEEEVETEGGQEEEDPEPTDNPNDVNKPSSLLDEYHKVKEATEQGDSNERSMLEGRIRAIVAKHPKVNPFKSSKYQEEFKNKTIEELKFALQSAEDQIGVCNPYGLPKAVLNVIEVALMKYTGKIINPNLKEDPALLGILEKHIPKFIVQYGDYIQLAEKIYSGIMANPDPFQSGVIFHDNNDVPK